MLRIAEFHWLVSPPGAVDEQLVVYDDGTAWLVVRRPRVPSPTVGSYRCRPPQGDLDALAARGPGPFTIDLLAPDQPLRALFPVLERVRALAAASPHATATFHSRAIPAEPNFALMVVAAGERAVEFELEPSRCTVHFYASGQTVGWQPFPPLAAGFIGPDATGLGGLHRRAIVDPGAYGAIAFAVR